MDYTSSYVIFILFLGISLSTLINAELCNNADSDNECYSLEDWKGNILCRLQGGPPPSQTSDQRTNGYIAWAMDQKSGDTSATRKTRYDAMRFFIDAEHELMISYPNRRPNDRRSMLERFERGINDWGRRLGALDTNDGWTVSTTNCGVTAPNFTRNTPCGSRANNDPNCPRRGNGAPPVGGP